MGVGWKAFFIALHIVTIFLLVLLVCDYPFIDAAIYEKAKSNGTLDALGVAAQLGRLDLVTLFVGLVALVIGVFAVLGFWVYGHVVERAARKETKEIAPEIMTNILRQEPELWVRVIRDNPAMFKSALKEAMSETPDLENISDAEAVNIANEAAGE